MRDHDVCPWCDAEFGSGAELELCECGEPELDHGAGGCRRCACSLYEWSGALGCPGCLTDLDTPVVDDASATHRAA